MTQVDLTKTLTDIRDAVNDIDEIADASYARPDSYYTLCDAGDVLRSAEEAIIILLMEIEAGNDEKMTLRGET